MVTRRERDILDALVSNPGDTNSQLAARLHVTPGTLRTRLYEIADKLLEDQDRRLSIRTALATRWNCELFRIGVDELGAKWSRKSSTSPRSRALKAS